jgi:PAS domain S-box-containing protein
MTDAPARAAFDTELRDVVHRSPLALALISLDSLVLVDANDAALAILGRREPLRFPVRLHEVLPTEDAAPAARALRLIADGTIHSYDAARRLRREDGETVNGHIWVRALPYPEHSVALALFVPEPDQVLVLKDDDVRAIPARRFPLDAPLVVGSMDAGTHVTQLSADVERVLGIAAEALLGEAFVDLVHPDDIGVFLSAIGRAVSNRTSVGVRARLQRGADEVLPVELVVTPIEVGDTKRIGFVIGPGPAAAAPPGAAAAADDRVAKLEQHLWRIAAEVQAAGVVDTLHRLPDHDEFPELANLSTRQWHVLSALMRGERVPEIANAMSVSQSTVRNHLSKIFRALGVHSQSELLALLRERNRRNV